LRSAAFDFENIIYLFYKTSYPNEEVNSAEPSPSVSIPWVKKTEALFYFTRQVTECFCICLFFFSSICISVHPSVCLSIHMFVCLLINLSFRFSIYLSACLSICSCACSIYPTVCLFVHIFICLSHQSFVYLFVSSIKEQVAGDKSSLMLKSIFKIHKH
jgi:hypothetical protein